ncbi:PREDICTED: uncharacterized protein LOC104608236 [Nelumbo nucifera]|uniref:Uncharacterized protein LOC104608236 n=2 Tax=Nelumbo nucifera TaxID=4432 RepID=A0A1U8B087_NELNU|nr:PREDICTED: uncharacterized protein LOC104608236 [Nelumbo nucifera]DAD20936.1 TPA_asm: hypothetical protein HUJ06_022399 [Nelumbo nucifera]
MKKSGFLMASMAAASATAISASNTSSSSSSDFFANSKIQTHCEDSVSSKGRDNFSARMQPSSDKFAPRFDGLRFIETLVTAHR